VIVDKTGEMVCRVILDDSKDPKRPLYWATLKFTVRVVMPENAEKSLRVSIDGAAPASVPDNLGACFVAAHTTDVADFGRFERFRSFGEFERVVRDALGDKTPILYFSGGSALHHGPIAGDGDRWTHVWTDPLPIDDDLFKMRLDEVIRVWGEDPSNLPAWHRLKRDWVRDAMDCVVAMRLLCDSPEGLQTFLKENIRRDPFEGDQGRTEIDRLGCTPDDRVVLLRLCRLRGVQEGNDAVKELLDRAIKILRRSRLREGPGHLLEKERRRISHDLFENDFGAFLIPGWRDERLGDRDVLVLAIAGDPTCGESVRQATSVWATKVFPALERLSTAIATQHDVKRTEAVDRCMNRLRAADRVISGFVIDNAPIDCARRFWAACDTVREVLSDLKSLATKNGLDPEA
jgi:hypothetical protein